MNDNDRPVSIVLLNWNTSADTIECLESLFNIKYSSYELIIIDNDSEPGEVERILAYLSGDIEVDTPINDYNRENKPVKYYVLQPGEVYERKFSDRRFNREVFLIENSQNSGFSEGNNTGIQFALNGMAEYVMLLNNDTVVHEDFLGEMVDEMERLEQPGVAGPKIYDYNAPDEFQSVGGYINWPIAWAQNLGNGETDRGQYDQVQYRDFVWGTCELIDSEVFNEVGMLDSWFFFGADDYDFCTRVKESGYDVIFVPSAKIWHKGGKSREKISDYQGVKAKVNYDIGFANNRSWYRILKKKYMYPIFYVPLILRQLVLIWLRIRKAVHRLQRFVGN